MATKTATKATENHSILYLLTVNGVQDLELPFNNDAFLHNVIQGQVGTPLFSEVGDREAVPTMDSLPSGAEAKRLREAAGITVAKLTKALQVGGNIIPHYEAGLITLVDEILPHATYGGVKGPLRLYGCIEAWLKAKAGEKAAA